jgi:hypothetical protein
MAVIGPELMTCFKCGEVLNWGGEIGRNPIERDGRDARTPVGPEVRAVPLVVGRARACGRSWPGVPADMELRGGGRNAAWQYG